MITAFSSTASAVLHRVGWTPPIRSRSDIRVVFYHGIGDGSSPCMRYLNDEIPGHAFARQIDYLRDRYRIVSLDDATDQLGANHVQPICCITFDDGLASVYDLAYPILAERSIPAAVFVNTAVMGNRRLLWQHLLSYLLHVHGLAKVAEALSRHGFEVALSARTAPALIRMCKSRFRHLAGIGALESASNELDVDPSAVAREQKLYLDWEQLEEMTRHGFTFCSHTASHLPLNGVDDDCMRREIAEAQLALAERPGTSGRFLSFPFGMRSDYGLKAHDYALTSGYDYVLAVEDGWNPHWRVRKERCLRRVCLGPAESNDTRTYAAIELRPLIKGVLKSMAEHHTFRAESAGRA